MVGDDSGIFDFRQYHGDLFDELEHIQQNNLMNESEFIKFASDRGIPVSGVINGDPGDFNERGWLTNDGSSTEGAPLFHPFRLYTIHRILELCRLNISASASLKRQTFPRFLENVVKDFMPTDNKIGVASVEWNRITDLAVLLEPLYWPDITRRYTRSGPLSELEYEVRLQNYRQKALLLVEQLDAKEWQKHHERLRLDSASIDDNHSLYLLLRVSHWSSREKLKGRIAAALWIRHMAEVLRLAFENIHKLSWPEEDCAFGQWMEGGRTVAYGSERPLDDVLHSRPRLAFYFGLSTGSAIRWYVEGDTEYHAILSVITDPAKSGVEIVNLRGNLATNRDNIALKLRDGLIEDCSLRRFSIISFDTDVAENVKAIRLQVEQGNVVGYIAAHDPDFEFANFTLNELVEIAARIDEGNDFSGASVREANWDGVSCGSDFERRYCDVSVRKPRSLKGKNWGAALAEYAGNHPKREDNKSERPFWREIRAALQSRTSHYDMQKKEYGFDPNTFEAVRHAPK